MTEEELKPEEEKKPIITIKKEEEKPPPAGIRIKPRKEAEVEPPISAEEEIEEEFPPGVKVAKEGKIPISPAVVKPLLRFEGIALAETTKWRGWLYTEEDLQNIAELVEQTGLEATPLLQLFLALGGLHAEKGMAFFMWKRAGEPEEMRLKEGEGIQRG